MDAVKLTNELKPFTRQNGPSECLEGEPSVTCSDQISTQVNGKVYACGVHDHEKYQNNGPVVIGGVGGSGTRVVAQVLSIFGYFIGDDLNEPLDNLWYTLLFKRRRWFTRNRSNQRAMQVGFNILDKAMASGGRLNPREWVFLARAVAYMTVYGHNHQGDGRGSWSVRRALKMIEGIRESKSGFIGWGWKEPNAHLLVEEMADHFEGFKYVHTIRHGLDMAFSKNQQQLFNWAPLYGVETPKKPDQVPPAALRYWLRANDEILKMGEKIGPEKFLLMDFSRLCNDPRGEIERLRAFLKITPSEAAFEDAVALPKTPRTAGRYQKNDLRQFSDADLVELQRLGYPVS